jgi:hypothetical protein
VEQLAVAVVLSATTMKHATVIALAGAVLTCPQCHARIGVLRLPLYQEHTFGLDAIRFETGQEPANNQAACRKCGATYAEKDELLSSGGEITMLIHTDQGWLPRLPPTAGPRTVIIDQRSKK